MTRFKLCNVAVAVVFGVAAGSTALPSLAAGKHDHSPKFGGMVIEAKDMDYEIVAKPDVIQIYLSDHGKPAKVEGSKAKVTLLNGTEKSEIELAPTGNRLEAKGNFKVAKGTKGIAIVTLNGKATTVRFELK